MNRAKGEHILPNYNIEKKNENFNHSSKLKMWWLR